MNIEKLKAFAQAERKSEESTEIRPAPKPAEPEYQPEAIYIPIEDDDPTEIPDDGFAAVSNEEEPELPETETIEEIIAKCFPEDKSYNIKLDRLIPPAFAYFHGRRRPVGTQLVNCANGHNRAASGALRRERRV